MKPADSYFLRFRGRVSGPFPLERLRSMAYAGQLGPIHEVSADRTSWAPATSIPGLLPEAVPPAVAASSALVVSPTPPRTSTPAAERWYYMDRDGHRIGPLSRRQLADLADDGEITDRTEVWSKGTRDWVSLAESGVVRPTHRSQVDSARYDVREARPPRRGNKVGLVIGIGAVAFLVFAAATAATVFFVLRKPGTDEGSSHSGPLLVSGFADLSASEQTRAREETIGLVICGVHIRNADGSWTEEPISSGSGFVVSPSGKRITNKHVVNQILELKDARKQKALETKLNATITPKIWAFFGRDSRYECEVLYQSLDYDLAILETKKNNSRFLAMCQTLDGDIPHLKGLTAVGFPGNDRSARKWLEGQGAAARVNGPAVQHAFEAADFKLSVDSGDVRKTPISLRIDGRPSAFYLVHSASTSHGNSGGPLLCSDGTAVGINTIIRPIEVKDTAGNKVLISQGGQNCALTLHQLKREIARYVPDAVWRKHPE